MLASLLRIGWAIKRQSGSHRTLTRDGWPDLTIEQFRAHRLHPHGSMTAKPPGVREGEAEGAPEEQTGRPGAQRVLGPRKDFTG